MLLSLIALSDYVFCDTDGGWLRHSNVRKRSFLPIRDKAKLPANESIPRVRFHDMRHTACVLMLLAGVNAKVVSEIMGHSSVAFTLDRYGHVLPAMQQEAADKMDVLFRAAN